METGFSQIQSYLYIFQPTGLPIVLASICAQYNDTIATVYSLNRNWITCVHQYYCSRGTEYITSWLFDNEPLFKAGATKWSGCQSCQHFGIGAIEIFSYGCFKIQNICMQRMLKLEVLMPCLHRKIGLYENELESIFNDI